MVEYLELRGGKNPPAGPLGKGDGTAGADVV
jgi:hypothetical protein